MLRSILQFTNSSWPYTIAMASAFLKDELDCSICLFTFKDPVMLKCGHNYCRACIDRVLDTQVGSGVYFCPECREQFYERPALMKNINLHNVAERFLCTRPDQDEMYEICCTYCVDSAVPAVKFCLMCEASLCDKHLRVHSKSPEHVLSETSTSLEKRKCSVHKKGLLHYCTEDAACIGGSFRLDEEHRGHRLEMLGEASEKKKKKLKNVLQKLITKREETEERVQGVEERRKKAQEKAARETERFTALFTEIRRRLDDLEKRVLSEISRQQNEKSLSLSALIKQLEIKKDELSWKISHIEELCNKADPLTVLNEPDTHDLCDPEGQESDEDTEGHDRQPHDVDDLDVAAISDTFHTLCDMIADIRSRSYMEDPTDILLDVFQHKAPKSMAWKPQEFISLINSLPDPDKLPKSFSRRISQIQKIYSATWKDLTALVEIKAGNAFWPIMASHLKPVSYEDDTTVESGDHFTKKLKRWAIGRLADQAKAIQDLTQDNGETVEKFFYRLNMTFSDLGYDFRDKAHNQIWAEVFVQGLRKQIRKQLQATRPEYHTLRSDVLYHVAKGIEQNLAVSRPKTIKLLQPKSTLKCHNCGKTGHFKRECRHLRKQQQEQDLRLPLPSPPPPPPPPPPKGDLLH
ncbi:uncharacterized protein [Dendropsophus ebraccatus]|uniref:uncharacterized protein n=1 Tax=Dendropsophus ebraccatus TaxID=150705 RepID=UPI003831D0EE